MDESRRVEEKKKIGEPEKTNHKEKERKIRRHTERAFLLLKLCHFDLQITLLAPPPLARLIGFVGVLTIGHCLKLRLSSSVWPFLSSYRC